jgi:hypothetical protein
MKSLMIVLALFFHFECMAQMNGYVYPILPINGSAEQNFVPKGWKIDKKISCDFNSDSLLDFALVIQKIDPIKVDSQDYFPKILLIAFQNSKKTYTLNISTFKIFGEGNWGIGDDAFFDLGRIKTTLKIVFLTGGSEAVKKYYYFQFRSKEWLLTGYSDEMSGSQDPGVYVTNINFLTNKIESYTEINGKKVIDKHADSLDEILKMNNIKVEPHYLRDIDASAFIDPFVG